MQMNKCVTAERPKLVLCRAFLIRLLVWTVFINFGMGMQFFTVTTFASDSAQNSFVSPDCFRVVLTAFTRVSFVRSLIPSD
jgi:hypothetical protein